MNLPKAILWDMDGVLVDTSQIHVQAWKHVLTEQGISFDSKDFDLIYGLKNSEFFRLLVREPLEEQWIQMMVDQKEAHFRKISQSVIKPLPGVMEWLKRFTSWGCKQAVASSGEYSNVEFVLNTLAIRDYFDALVTPGELPGKPDPAVFIRASELLNVPYKDCIVIEDSLPGIDAAKKAGMHCIAITSMKPFDVRYQADIVVQTMAQLSTDQVISLVNH